MANTVTGDAPGKSDPFLASNFFVEIDGSPKIEGLFQDAGGLSVELDITEYKEVDAKGRQYTVKRPGQVKYGEITLKRGLTTNKDFYTWAKSICDGSNEFRRNGAISMVDYTGTPVAQWKFTNGWISKWSVSELTADTNDRVVEDVTLAIEELVREF